MARESAAPAASIASIVWRRLDRPGHEAARLEILALAVGSEASVRAAWLRFPGFELEPLDQVYRRVSESTYRYESGGGRFVADLAVDPSWFVTRYPGFCETEGARA